MKHISRLTLLLLFACSLLPATNAGADDLLVKGQKIYETNCLLCHGKDGKGNGPAGALLNPKPKDYTQPSFWTGNTTKTIAETIKNGKGQMPPFSLDDQSIKAVTYYIEHTFKPAGSAGAKP